MAKEMISANINFKPEVIAETPHMRARATWDGRLGHSTVQARNWRLACVISLLLSFVLAVGIVYQATLNKVVPMVIALDRESGEPKIIGKVTEVRYEPKIAEIRYFLSQFIQKVRSVPVDPVLIKRNWIEAYKMMRQGAAQILNDQTNNDPNSPLKNIGKTTVIVQVIAVTRVGNGDSYQVRWEETNYQEGGQVKVRQTMNGIFSIEIETPSDEKTLLINPLGIFIKSFQWTKEISK